MADGKDFSEWMGVILDVFNDRLDKTSNSLLKKVFRGAHEQNAPGTRCRLSPTADVPLHTSRAAMGRYC